MATKQALETVTETKTPAFVEIEKIFEQMKDLTENIGRRAYEFFEARGRDIGHDLEDWFRAESELMRRVPIEIKDGEQNIVVNAEVPGFTAEDIQISVDARQLMLSGKTETTEEKTDEQRVYNERRSNQFCRTLTLPTDVDATKATASLKEGVLEITLPKIAKPEAVQVEVQKGE